MSEIGYAALGFIGAIGLVSLVAWAADAPRVRADDRFLATRYGAATLAQLPRWVKSRMVADMRSGRDPDTIMKAYLGWES